MARLQDLNDEGRLGELDERDGQQMFVRQDVDGAPATVMLGHALGIARKRSDYGSDIVLRICERTVEG